MAMTTGDGFEAKFFDGDGKVNEILLHSHQMLRMMFPSCFGKVIIRGQVVSRLLPILWRLHPTVH